MFVTISLHLPESWTVYEDYFALRDQETLCASDTDGESEDEM